MPKILVDNTRYDLLEKLYSSLQLVISTNHTTPQKADIEWYKVESCLTGLSDMEQQTDMACIS